MRLCLAQRLRRVGGELLRLGEAHGFVFHAASGENAIGFADLEEGRPAEATARLERGRAGYSAAHAGYLLPAVLGGSGRAAPRWASFRRPSA